MTDDEFEIRSIPVIEINGFTRHSRFRINRKRTPVPVWFDWSDADEKYDPENLTEEEKSTYARMEAVPIQEIMYWLSWGNLLRQGPEEDGHDYPTGKAIHTYLTVSKKMYEERIAAVTVSEHVDPKWLKQRKAIPMKELVSFLAQFPEEPDREDIMLKLDAFVGQYV